MQGASCPAAVLEKAKEKRSSPLDATMSLYIFVHHLNRGLTIHMTKLRSNDYSYSIRRVADCGRELAGVGLGNELKQTIVPTEKGQVHSRTSQKPQDQVWTCLSKVTQR